VTLDEVLLPPPHRRAETNWVPLTPLADVQSWSALAGEEAAACHGYGWQADENDAEVDHRHVTEALVELVTEVGGRGEVGNGGTDEGTEQTRAPAVAAVRVRRILLEAPAAARTLRSPAVSLRIRPTVMARTLSARTIPAAVAHESNSESEGLSFFVSMVSAAALARCRAALISIAVSGCGDCMSHPAVVAWSP
jgi:hypothetical protein